MKNKGRKVRERYGRVGTAFPYPFWLCHRMDVWLWSEGGNGIVAEGLEVRGWGEVAFEGLF